MANGLQICPEGVVEIVVEISKKTVKIMAAILELNGFDLLLGNDALSQLNKVQIDYDEDRTAYFFCINDFDVDERSPEVIKVIVYYTDSISIYLSNFSNQDQWVNR